VIANEREKGMHVEKMRKKWQCIVRVKGIAVTQSFVSKTDARLFGQRKEVVRCSACSTLSII
jgi:hypothetical protein